MSKRVKYIVAALTATTMSQLIPTTAIAMEANGVEPKKATYGYFVDEYKKNGDSNYNTPETNPGIGVLSGFLELWEPGDSWDNGIKLNERILDANIQRSIEVTANLTEEEKYTTYLYDRRHQSYSSIGGLKEYASIFREKTNAGTTITDVIPEDATSVKYSDKGNSNGNWADADSELGKMVTLVNTLRGGYSSSNPSKNYYAYMRPFRWSDEVTVLDTLIPCLKPVEQAASDGGFPSGHTNAAYLASFALAYAVPEKYNDLLANASSLGDSRILAGMHSTLDVMGGRILGTALSAAILNDPANANLKEEAYEEGRKLLSENVEKETIEEKIANYKTNKAIYADRLIYDFEKTGESGQEMTVPKGAEVLLETRFPYLNNEQMRYVLKTTGIDSGYVLMNDTEGWARLNLFEAANGYGAFETDVTINMDGSKGGYNLEDSWLNDIEGNGQLTKQGTGTLILAGNNTYTGGTNVEEGLLIAYSSTAFGNGEVENNGGIISENVQGNVIISDDYSQDKESVLDLNIVSDSDCLIINGTAELNGALKVTISSDYEINDKFKIIGYSELADNSGFDTVEFVGLPTDYSGNIVYEKDGVYLVNSNVIEDNEELTVNINKLKEAIEKAETIDGDKYTVESYSILKEALTKAKEVLAIENINNDLVVEALANLNEALTKLEEKVQVPVLPDEDIDNEGSTDTDSDKDNSTDNGSNKEDNNISGNLPQTGGVGIAIPLVLGILTTIGGVFVSKKKK